jgi:hypothetical protein
MLEESLGPGSSIRDLVCEFRKWSVDVIAECLDSVTHTRLHHYRTFAELLPPHHFPHKPSRLSLDVWYRMRIPT